MNPLQIIVNQESVDRYNHLFRYLFTLNQSNKKTERKSIPGEQQSVKLKVKKLNAGAILPVKGSK